MASGLDGRAQPGDCSSCGYFTPGGGVGCVCRVQIILPGAGGLHRCAGGLPTGAAWYSRATAEGGVAGAVQPGVWCNRHWLQLVCDAAGVWYGRRNGAGNKKATTV